MFFLRNFKKLFMKFQKRKTVHLYQNFDMKFQKLIWLQSYLFFVYIFFTWNVMSISVISVTSECSKISEINFCSVYVTGKNEFQAIRYVLIQSHIQEGRAAHFRTDIWQYSNVNMHFPSTIKICTIFLKYVLSVNNRILSLLWAIVRKKTFFFMDIFNVFFLGGGEFFMSSFFFISSLVRTMLVCTTVLFSSMIVLSG